MINLKIRMINGDDFYLSHPSANNAQHWIRLVLMPMGTQLRWAEIFPGRMIQTNNIQEVRLMSEDEVEALNTPEAENNLGDVKEVSEPEAEDEHKR